MVSRSRPDQPEREIWRLLERIDRLETMVYGRSSSVTNGRTRFIGLESLIVIGSQLVSGLLHVIGRVTISGLGVLEVLGLIELDGTMRVTGDIIVLPGGKIQVGSMTIDPTTNGGSVKFAGGPEVYADGAQLSLYSGTGAFIELNGSVAKINGPGARWIEVDSSGFRVVGMPTKTTTETGLPVGAVQADSSGYLYRIVTG